MGLRGAVVPRAEQPVDRCRRVSVVDLEVSVVQVVELVAGGYAGPPAQEHPIEPGVGYRRADAAVEAGHDHDDRMDRHHPPEEEQGEVDDLLQGFIEIPVHGPVLVLQWCNSWAARYSGFQWSSRWLR